MNLRIQSDATIGRCMSEFEKTAAFAALLHGDERSSILYDLGVEISAPRPLRAWLSEAWSKCSRHAMQHVSARACMMLCYIIAL